MAQALQNPQVPVIYDLSNEDIEYDRVSDILRSLQTVTPYYCVPLNRPPDTLNEGLRFQPSFSDTDFNTSIVSTCIFGKTTTFERVKSIQDCIAEVRWANHIGVFGLVVPLPSNINIDYYRYVSTICNLSRCPVWITVPLAADGWQMWNTIRKVIGYNTNIRPLLSLQENLTVEFDLLQVWRAENVAGVIFAKQIVQDNGKLTRENDIFLHNLLDFDISIFISNFEPSTELVKNTIEYIEWLKTSRTEPSQYEKGIVEFRDTIEKPIQPLAHDLDSVVYETIEKEPFKYQKYRMAFILALHDKAGVIQQFSPLNPFRIMIAGAGRGPLVQMVIDVLNVNRFAHNCVVYAVEKNQNAVATLSYRKRTQHDWKNVEVIGCDMRKMNMPNKVDIVISELLGSFGDDELCPECLDALLPLVLKSDGVTIPRTYSNYIQPISNSVVYTSFLENQYSFEQPVICNQFNYAAFSSPQKCFTFVHPSVDDHQRFVDFKFVSKMDGALHGFSGTFNVELYKNVKLSTVPGEHTPDMFSWFPFFFPIQPPIDLKRGDVVEFLLWRNVTGHRVWYEWMVVTPLITKIFNSSGKHAMSLFAVKTVSLLRFRLELISSLEVE
ncbi:protein arginine N-methyltransferase, putative [Entamoeba invadens IP1]|uniref:Protein arginine N-methyltransferase n=1 Tax=Entamoeba invadens IP1 TaxID=370355 RepID=A0A0A1U257_ENTIV|nr:protein arginine N-methyltransferase, putative [Entamoeba invadens IP1]ELP88156.1 protein arginine N-methyltransferase, putative [Entamoeba invadens IP1]|eukprot:XP_004254927.1 protein arginine N-methyltransferase, putative [Entamoeba invadens IP1]